MTFVDAFKLVSNLGGGLMRRKGWDYRATLHEAGGILVRWPEHANWVGNYSPTLEDAQADDWEVEGGN